MKHTIVFALTPFLLCVAAGSARAQVDVGPQTQVDGGRGPDPCDETTIAVSPVNPLELVAGFNDYREGPPRTGASLSFDGGVTWNDFLLRPPAPNQSGN